MEVPEESYYCHDEGRFFLCDGHDPFNSQSQHCIINRAFPILFVPGETRTLWCRFILNHSVFYRRLNVSFRMTPVYLLGLLLVVYIPYMSETRLHLIFVSHSVRLFCSCRCCRHTLSLPPFKHHI